MDIVLLLAIYGAGISTVLLIREIVLGVLEFVRERHRLKVTASFSLKRGEGSKLFTYLEIGATNIGRRPITILQAGIGGHGPYSEVIYTDDLFNRVKLPIKLEDGEHVDFAFDSRELQIHGHTHLTRAFFKDAEGTYYETSLGKKLSEFIAFDWPSSTARKSSNLPKSR